MNFLWDGRIPLLLAAAALLVANGFQLRTIKILRELTHKQSEALVSASKALDRLAGESIASRDTLIRAKAYIEEHCR